MQKLDAFIDEHGGMHQKLLNKLQEKPEMVEESSNDIPVGCSLTTAIDTTGI